MAGWPLAGVSERGSMAEGDQAKGILELKVLQLQVTVW